MTFAAQGRGLYLAQDREIRIWNRRTDESRPFGEPFAEKAFCLATSADGETCVTGHDGGMIRFWNCETGRLIRTLKAHHDSVEQIAFSPDSRILVTGSWDGTAKLWEAASGQQLGVFDMPPHC